MILKAFKPLGLEVRASSHIEELFAKKLYDVPGSTGGAVWYAIIR